MWHKLSAVELLVFLNSFNQQCLHAAMLSVLRDSELFLWAECSNSWPQTLLKCCLITWKNKSKKKFLSSRRLEKETSTWPKASGGTGSLLAACSEFGIKAGEQVNVAVLGWSLTLTLSAGGLLKKAMLTCCLAGNCCLMLSLGLGLLMSSLSGQKFYSGSYPKEWD